MLGKRRLRGNRRRLPVFVAGTVRVSDLAKSSDEQNAASPAFQEEFAEYWNGLPDKRLFFGLLIPWLLLFHFLGNSTMGYLETSSLFVAMADVYNSTLYDESHGFLIPFVVVYLFWWKREELADVAKDLWTPALALLGAAVVLHVIGFVVQQARISVLALFLGIFAIMGLVWGRAWLRASFFPFVLFVFCMPLGSLTENITVPLRIIVTKISVWVSVKALNIGVVHDGTRIFDPSWDFHIDVAPACSGIRSLTALMILTTIVSFCAYASWWKRLTLIAAAIPVAIAGNVLRLTTVIIAAEAFGQKAVPVVHDHAWILTWGLALACMGGLYSLLKGRSPKAAEPIEGEEDV